MAKDGLALQHASAALRGSRDVVLAAVAQNGHAIRFADSSVRWHHAVALAALAQSGSALEHLRVVIRRPVLVPLSTLLYGETGY